MDLREAVNAVLAKCPDLARRAVVEYYPRVSNPLTGGFERRVFAYQFMNEAGRNIATYIPDMERFSGLIFQQEGGREYSVPIQGSEKIDHMFGGQDANQQA